MGAQRCALRGRCRGAHRYRGGLADRDRDHALAGPGAAFKDLDGLFAPATALVVNGAGAWPRYPRLAPPGRRPVCDRPPHRRLRELQRALRHHRARPRAWRRARRAGRATTRATLDTSRRAGCAADDLIGIAYVPPPSGILPTDPGDARLSAETRSSHDLGVRTAMARATASVRTRSRSLTGLPCPREHESASGPSRRDAPACRTPRPWPPAVVKADVDVPAFARVRASAAR